MARFDVEVFGGRVLTGMRLVCQAQEMGRVDVRNPRFEVFPLDFVWRNRVQDSVGFVENHLVEGYGEVGSRWIRLSLRMFVLGGPVTLHTFGAQR